MDGVGNTLAGSRVGGVRPPLREGHGAERGACADRPMPIASSIYWTPVAATGSVEATGAYPIFITQRALGAVHDHVAAEKEGASLGLLLGSVLRCPDTGICYIVIETTLPLAWPADGERATPILQEALAAADDRVLAGGRPAVGWYHSEGLRGARLSAGDIDAHLTLRDQPWQVALVVVSRDPPRAGFFRPSTGATWSSGPLPFYELLDEICLLPDGRKVTDLAWQTYRTDEEVLASDRVPRGWAAPAAPPHAPLGPILLFPDEVDEPLGPKPVARVAGHRARFAVYGLTAVLVAAGVVTLYQVLAARRSPLVLAGTRELDSPSALQHVDRTADTLALALAAFDVRAHLFERRQMACPELSHGLVEVEQRWIAYNAARSHAFVLDSTRDARDLSGYAAVDGVERRFERSRCPRP